MTRAEYGMWLLAYNFGAPAEYKMSLW